MTQSKLARIVTRLFAAFAILMMVAALPNAAFAEDPSEGDLTQSDDVATGIQMQNVGDGPADVSVELIPMGGGQSINLDNETIAARDAFNYYMPNYKNVTGGSYSLVATADQPLEAMVQTTFNSNGAVGNYTSVAPGTDVVLPFVTRNWAGQYSEITIQNASQDTSANYTITVYGINNSGQQEYTNDLPAKAAQQYTMRQDFPVSDQLPNNGADFNLPDGFLGYARIQVNSGKGVVVQSFIEVEGQPAVSAFTGVPAESASSTLFAPLLRRNFDGDTGMQFAYVGDEDSPASTNVNITFYTDDASLNHSETGSLYDEQYSYSMTINKNSSQSLFLGLPVAEGWGDNGQMPSGTRDENSLAHGFNGWLGVAVIESDEPIFGVINDSVYNPDTYQAITQGTNNMATAENAGRSFALPLVRNNFPANSLQTTGVQVMNIPDNGTDANLTVTYKVFQYDTDENSDTYAQVISTNEVTDQPVSGDTTRPRPIADGGSINVYQGTFDAGVESWPGNGNWVGSAIIESDQDIVVIVNDSTSDRNAAPSPLDAGNFGGLLLGQ
jgi:hypothetical protein